MQYNKEGVDSSIKSIEKVIENNKKITRTYYQLKESLIRIQRALQSEFWFDKLNNEQKRTVYKNYRTEYNQRNPEAKALPYYLESNFSFYDFTFAMRKQWESDRKRLISNGQIEA